MCTVGVALRSMRPHRPLNLSAEAHHTACAPHAARRGPRSASWGQPPPALLPPRGRTRRRHRPKPWGGSALPGARAERESCRQTRPHAGEVHATQAGCTPHGPARQEAPALTAFSTLLLSAFKISPADVLRTAKFIELDGSQSGLGSNSVEGSYDLAMHLGLSVPGTSATGKARGSN